MAFWGPFGSPQYLTISILACFWAKPHPNSTQRPKPHFIQVVYDIPQHSKQPHCIVKVSSILYMPSASQQCPLYGAWQGILVVFCAHQHSNGYKMHITPTLQHIQVFSGITRNNISLCCIRGDPLAFWGPSAPPQYLFIWFLGCFWAKRHPNSNQRPKLYLIQVVHDIPRHSLQQPSGTLYNNPA